jgi:hypothetical protein
LDESPGDPILRIVTAMRHNRRILDSARDL